MKLNKLFALLLFLVVAAFNSAQSQDKRTVKTKVADILMYLPAADNAQAERLFKDLIGLGDEGITMVTDQVQPNGIAAGIPYRFAVSLLTHYATTSAEKTQIERVYLSALSKAGATEVKSYFIDNLKWIASNASVTPLSKLIGDKDLFDQAIAALEILNTTESKQALLNALSNPPSFAYGRLLQAEGRLQFTPATPALTKAAGSTDLYVKHSALWSLALMGDPASAPLLIQSAKATGFKNDPSEATNALIEYLHTIKANKTLVSSVSKTIIEAAPDAAQQHYRLAAVEAWSEANPVDANKFLIKEYVHPDAEYRKEILNIAVPFAKGAESSKPWLKEYKKRKGQEQADVLAMLIKANKDVAFNDAQLIPALSSSNANVRAAAAQGLGDSHDKKYAPALTAYLLKCTDDAEIASAKADLLELTDKDVAPALTQKLTEASSKGKIALIQILAERRAVTSFDALLALTSSSDAQVAKAAYTALPNVSGTASTAPLLKALAAASGPDDIAQVQSAIIAGNNEKTTSLINDAYASQKLKLLPVLPYLSDKTALAKVTDVFYKGTDAEKDVAFTALQNWQNGDAVRVLIKIRQDEQLSKYHASAFTAALSQTTKSSWPDDEKLLILRQLMSLTNGKAEKLSVLRSMGGIRTFLSLVAVSEFIDDAQLGSTAVRAAMQITLPTADAKPGMTGSFVRETLQRVKATLIGEDSQYELIDIDTYLAKLPYTRGYEPIFNGKDLTGWQGLVENPIARSKMTAELLAKKQKEANAAISKNWSVKDGMIVFQGEGANLCTVRPYGDFEMIVDWKISKNGDSGIYLRGSPQVQIWDIARVESGAQVGSGGLYNNQKERSTPLVVADNPVGEWNTFRIKMLGDKVTVYLNGVLVVDNVTMENYWDRALPVFTEDAIELQAHGTDLAFRNIYVKEIGAASVQLSGEEKKEGFSLLFNGKDLDQWIGNKTEYVAEDNTISLYPSKEEHGNLNSAKEYADFVFRFEFQLTPGANNGIGIHAPVEGDAAYAGKEIQVLDDTAPVYATLEPWQYNGSVYGTIAAKRGHLKPVGDWNKEEIYVKGDYFKVTLNGTVITEGNVKELSKKGTLDHKDHPGLLSHKGHIEFLGHGSVVRFRNIRIKEL